MRPRAAKLDLAVEHDWPWADFLARTQNERASVRGSAYHWARKRGARVRCERVGKFVRVYLMGAA